jgi:hypothetical protein
MWTMTITPPAGPKWILFGIIVLFAVIIIFVVKRFLASITYSYMEETKKLTLFPSEFSILVFIIKGKDSASGKLKKIFYDTDGNEVAFLEKRFFALNSYFLTIPDELKVPTKGTKKKFPLVKKIEKIVINARDLEEKATIVFGERTTNSGGYK